MHSRILATSLHPSTPLDCLQKTVHVPDGKTSGQEPKHQERLRRCLILDVIRDRIGDKEPVCTSAHMSMESVVDECQLRQMAATAHGEKQALKQR
jgi:hypothetical protein